MPVHRRARSRRPVLVVALIALLTSGAAPAAGTTAPATVAMAASSGRMTFVGHGWGHGRGMGQYGALGYAVDFGKTYTWILGHYYGGANLSSGGTPATLDVELTRFTGKDLLVAGGGLTVNGAGTAAGVAALRVHARGDGTFEVFTAAGCGGPWSSVGVVGSGVAVGSSSGMVSVCESTMLRTYRGSLVSVWTAGSSYAFNRVAVEDYLRGVVPRESPASWASLGSGRGAEALKAQAVAARSYALASSRTSGAKTCDTTSCQVYLGYAEQPYGGAVKRLEDARTDAAVAATAGQVLRLASNGAVARAEFSSSTGGYTAGGTFPAVPDDGDSVGLNPNHDWTTEIATSDVAAKLGLAGIRSFDVTARNGLGEDGGRVTSVTVVDTSGASHPFTGDEIRVKLGLKSNWFVVSWISPDEAANVVRALYHDVLGRGVDPSGLATWTDYVLVNRSPRGLADKIVMSRERLEKLVAAQYQGALLREPERAGLDNWVAHLAAGDGVYDLMIGIYGSGESLQKLGGGDVSAWVDALYQGILGRSASSADKAFWTSYAVGHGRPATVAAIARSDEAGMRRLTTYYRTFLQRDVDPSGRATFLPMMTDRGDFDVPVRLGSSPEYWSRAQERAY